MTGAQRYETVADALEAVDLPADHYHGAETYEAYCEPLKLTAGAVCLRVGDGPSAWHVSYRKGGELYRVESGDRVYPFELKAFINAHERGNLAIKPRLTREVSGDG